MAKVNTKKVKKTFKKYEVIRVDTYKFFVAAKNEEALKERLKSNPDFSECGQCTGSKFTAVREVKNQR